MKNLFVIACCILAGLTAEAQGSKDPSHWNMKVVPASGAYNMVFEVKLDKGWHVWSLTPGGDGSLIAPSFNFDKGSYTMIGTIDEFGDIKEVAMDGIDGKVRYFSEKAEFRQAVKAAPGAKIKGTFEYQLCNDVMCLPPKTASFEFIIP